MPMNVSGNVGQIANSPKWFQNMKADQTPQKAKDVLPLAGDDPVKVTLSKEGRDFYRQKVQNSNGISVDEIAKQKEMLSKLFMSAEDGMETQFHNKLVEKNGVLDKGNFDKDQLMGNCLSVYMSMYDEIKQGYENGTR